MSKIKYACIITFLDNPGLEIKIEINKAYMRELPDFKVDV